MGVKCFQGFSGHVAVRHEDVGQTLLCGEPSRVVRILVENRRLRIRVRNTAAAVFLGCGDHILREQRVTGDSAIFPFVGLRD